MLMTDFGDVKWLKGLMIEPNGRLWY